MKTFEKLRLTSGYSQSTTDAVRKSLSADILGQENAADVDTLARLYLAEITSFLGKTPKILSPGSSRWPEPLTKIILLSLDAIVYSDGLSKWTLKNNDLELISTNVASKLIALGANEQALRILIYIHPWLNGKNRTAKPSLVTKADFSKLFEINKIVVNDAHSTERVHIICITLLNTLRVYLLQKPLQWAEMIDGDNQLFGWCEKLKATDCGKGQKLYENSFKILYKEAVCLSPENPAYLSSLRSALRFFRGTSNCDLNLFDKILYKTGISFCKIQEHDTDLVLDLYIEILGSENSYRTSLLSWIEHGYTLVSKSIRYETWNNTVMKHLNLLDSHGLKGQLNSLLLLSYHILASQEIDEIAIASISIGFAKITEPLVDQNYGKLVFLVGSWLVRNIKQVIDCKVFEACALKLFIVGLESLIAICADWKMEHSSIIFCSRLLLAQVSFLLNELNWSDSCLRYLLASSTPDNIDLQIEQIIVASFNIGARTYHKSDTVNSIRFLGHAFKLTISLKHCLLPTTVKRALSFCKSLEDVKDYGVSNYYDSRHVSVLSNRL